MKKNLVKTIYILLWVLAIGFGAGVESANTFFEVIRGFVLSLGCFYLIYKMHNLVLD